MTRSYTSTITTIKMSYTAKNDVHDHLFDVIENSLSSAIWVSSDTSTEDILKILDEYEMKNCNKDDKSVKKEK